MEREKKLASAVTRCGFPTQHATADLGETEPAALTFQLWPVRPTLDVSVMPTGGLMFYCGACELSDRFTHAASFHTCCQILVILCPVLPK